MTKTVSFLLLLSLSINNLLAQDLSILLVHDSYDLTRVDSVKKAIIVAGYQYDLFDAADHKKSPSASLLSNYELVIWYTGNDYVDTYFWNGNDTDNEALKTYLDQGGMLWLQGFDVLRDRYSSPPVSFLEGDFAHDYLGIKKYVERTPNSNDVSVGLPQVDAVVNNGICQTSPVKWSFSSGTMWGVDACEPADDAQAVYQMGPSGHSLSQYFAGIYNETQDYKVLTFTFEMARLKNPPSPYIESLFREVLDYFNQFANATPIDVSNVTISSEKGEFEITENGGTLQLIAEVLPENAKNKQLIWSIDAASSTNASIDATGLLVASGTYDGNGTVSVIVTSKDEISIFDTIEITIANQGE